MINIKQHLLSTGKIVDDFLKEKAELLWDHLNSSTKNSTITEDAKNFLSQTGSSDHQKKYTKAAAARHNSFMNHLTQPGKLKEIIIAEPKDFERLHNQLSAILTSADYNPPLNKKVIVPFSELLLSKVFRYKKYRNSVFCSELYVDLNFLQATCSYCNEYPVKIVQNLRKGSKKPLLHFDLDHFYAKSSHPYFALSFYNHIPSCKYCNSLHKGTTPFSTNTHIHPYSQSFDHHYMFKYSHRTLIGDPINDVSINSISKFNDKLCIDLDIENRYKSNLSYANINRLIEMLTDYSHILGEKSVTDEKGLAFLKERLIDFGLQLDGNKILEKPWSKMQRDLVKFIDIYNHLKLEN